MSTVNQENKFGFFDIGLRIFQVKDESQLTYLYDEQALEENFCHECVLPVITNFKCMIKYMKPGERTEAIRDLEQAHQLFPRNLNILGNLADVYKETLGLQDKERCRQKILEIVESRDGKIEVARSEVEQGYIMMIDLHSETRDGSEKKVKDLITQVEESLKFTRSVIERKRNENILDHLIQIQKQYLGTNTDCFKETTQERTLALRKLEKGVKTMKGLIGRNSDAEVTVWNRNLEETEVVVWSHYLGKAYMRVSGGSNEISSQIEKIIYVEKSAETFVEVADYYRVVPTTNRDAVLLSRTYAYLLYLCTQKKYALSKSPKLTATKVQDVVIHENPETVMEMINALSERFPDRVTLNKVGIVHCMESKWNHAETILKMSIERFPQSNWYAYSLLCFMFLKKYEETMKNEQRPSAKLIVDDNQRKDLLDAMRFGEQALRNRKTSITLYRMAKVCKYLGKTKEAITYLKDALESHECKRHAIFYSLLGSCLYEEEQTDSAFRMMKIAMTLEAKNQRDPLIFRDFLVLLLDMFRHYMFRQNEKQREDLLKIICCVLEEGHRKHSNRIKYQTIGAINQYPHEMVEVLLVMIRRELSDRDKTIIEMCLKALAHHKGQGVKRRGNDLQKFYAKRCEETATNIQDLEADEPQQDGANIETQHGDYLFDYYILFPRSVKDWVEKWFLDELGSDYFTDKQLLKGLKCKRGDRASYILKKCKKVLIVISEDFEKPRNLSVGELAQQILRKLTENNPERAGDIIPVLRDAKDIPDFLKTFVPCDCDELSKIRNAILGFESSRKESKGNDVQENAEQNVEDDAENDIEEDAEQNAELDDAENDVEDAEQNAEHDDEENDVEDTGQNAEDDKDNDVEQNPENDVEGNAG